MTPETMSLAGSWRFQLDPSRDGLQEKWFERSLPGKIQLPGSLPEHGIGDEITTQTKWTGDVVDRSWFTAPEYEPYRQPGNIKVPFWLQPTKCYVGAAWYQRDIEIPKSWLSKRVGLTLERPHWETRVWVDSRPLGSNQGLSAPHEYDLGIGLTPGKHRLTIRVDNSLVVDVGVNSHCISDHTQGNWNGIVGDLTLRATESVWIADLQVYPHLASKSATVKVRLGNATGQPGSGSVAILIAPVRERVTAGVERTVTANWTADGGAVEAEVTLGDNVALWDEFEPNLYVAEARLPWGAGARSTKFGLREISTQSTQFLLNGHKIFIRGTLECCIFPLTGHPPTDVASWKRIIRVAKSYGLNLFRFHSYCPPEAAFDAADELGFYYQVETCWANQSTTLGDGKPVDQWVYDETRRILDAFGNHPSFLFMPYGNEPGGNKANAYLAQYVDHFKTADPRRLWTSGSGWPQLAQNQFHVSPEPRIQSWGGGLNSRINGGPPETTTDYREYIAQRSVPVISHEIGQWCVYPNFDEIPKYRGYLKPKNFDIFHDSFQAHHLGNLALQFLLASGKLQTLCYKEEIESALRTPGMGGFELLDLHDFPGQGTALVGVLDPFWGDKGYVTAREYSRFCSQTVPLARLRKRVFTTDESLDAELEIAHFGPAPLREAVTTWQLVGDNRRAVTQGLFAARDIPLGNGINLGKVEIPLREMPAPARYKLVVTVSQDPAYAQEFRAKDQRAKWSLEPGRSNSTFQNDWDVWVYPLAVDTNPPNDVAVVDHLGDDALTRLQAGGKVLMLIPPTRVRADRLGKVALGFSSIFWNTAWTGRQPPHTLGILCDPKNPALADFPTDYHSNWQWWYLISRAGAMILDDLPKDLRPIVEVIDDWVTNRKLGLLFEVKVGRGKLVVCSIDLKSDRAENPVARQMLHSLLAYMASTRFNPTVAVSASQVRRLMAEPSRMEKRGVRILRADSAAPGYEADIE